MKLFKSSEKSIKHMHSKTVMGKDFNPSPQLLKLYYVYIIPVFLILMIPAIIISLIVPFLLVFLIPMILIFGFVFYWMPKFYRTIIYKLTGDDMTWRRGVWFKNTGIVPYNRITNVDIIQGPISRALGIGSLKIQTAGYSGQNTRTAEIRIDGVVEFFKLF